MDRDLQPAGGGLDVELRRAAPLLDREQEALAGRPERQEAVHPARREEIDVRADRDLVERFAAVSQRRQGCG
jgi:hypothetical protein